MFVLFGFGMLHSVRLSRFRGLKLAVLAVVVFLVVSVVVWYVLSLIFSVPPSSGLQLNDPLGDVLLSMGSSYPGMVDLVGGSLSCNGTLLTVDVEVKDAASVLGDGETVNWNVLLALENSTDAIKAYELSFWSNSTGYYGSLIDVETGADSTVAGQFLGKRFSLRVDLAELAVASEIEWSVRSAYQMLLGDELAVYATDVAPDDGLQVYVFSAD